MSATAGIATMIVSFYRAWRREKSRVEIEEVRDTLTGEIVRVIHMRPDYRPDDDDRLTLFDKLILGFMFFGFCVKLSGDLFSIH